MNIIPEITGEKTKRFLILLGISIPIIGHFSAYLYYLSFGIEYFRFSSWTSGASFLWEHIDNIISGSAIILVIYHVLNLLMLPILDKYIEGINFNSKKISIFISNFHYIYFFIFVAFMFSVYLKEGKNEFQMVNNEIYIPYVISLKSGVDIKCVRPLGTIGDYRILVGKNTRLIVRDDEILTASPLALESPNLSLFLESPDDYSSWSIFWDKECKSKSGDYFNYSYPKLGFWEKMFTPLLTTKIVKPE